MARGALVPDGDDAARRPHPRRLGRQHHAQRAGPADAADERLGDAAGDLQRRHEHAGRRCRRLAPDAALPVHVRAARRARRSTPARTRTTRTLEHDDRASGRPSAPARSTATARSCTGPARSSSPAPGRIPTSRTARSTNRAADDRHDRGQPGVAAKPRRCTTRAPTTRSPSLPDGTVLATGGGTSLGRRRRSRTAVLATEIWDPDTDTWKETAAAPAAARCTTRPRCCCRTGACCSPAAAPSARPSNETNAEIFSPPYLFKGAAARRSPARPAQLALRPDVHGQHARRGAHPEGGAHAHGLGDAQLRHGPALHAR